MPGGQLHCQGLGWRCHLNHHLGDAGRKTEGMANSTIPRSLPRRRQQAAGSRQQILIAGRLDGLRLVLEKVLYSRYFPPSSLDSS